MLKERLICPLCSDAVDTLLFRFHIESERAVLQLIKEKNPGWAVNDGLCSRCVDYYQATVLMQQLILPEIGPYFPVKSVDDFVILPTPIRLNTDPRYTGKAVTICFIDSGFQLHPDLVASQNRVKIHVDITQSPNAIPFNDDVKATGACWHGTMTTVVCAGDGCKSNGLYRGIASGAELVLLKVQDEGGRITTENITKALQWVLDHHECYNIKIVNMSVADDEAISYKNSTVDKLAEQLVTIGITVVAAVGNDETGSIKPPANSPHVIAVGGINDNNDLENGNPAAYHSTYGTTIDGLMKPELVANSIWIAAPILIGTEEKEKAELLHKLVKYSDEALQNAGNGVFRKAGIYYDGNEPMRLRDDVVQQIMATKFFSPDYMHVDGTSFAAPIVCAVIAQLLEANPLLTPKQIRQVLFSTAKQLPGIQTIRQGFGYIQPRQALLKVLNNEIIMKQQDSPFINHSNKTIEFYIHNSCAAKVSLAGTFNHWAQDVLLMEAGRDGLWKIEIPILEKGRYHYKFFIDDKRWVEDVENSLREHDGFNGWNSVLEII
ncbi:MAG: S8 family serine peptidase [Ferruginibacter sp.]